MGNSSTSSPCGMSKREVLLRGYECFTIPQKSFKNNLPGDNFQNGTIVTVNGNSDLKGNLYASKYYFNPNESDKQIDNYFERYESKELELFPLIKVHGVKQIEKNNMCSKWNWFSVVTQEIISFDQIEPGLSFQQCLYVFFEALMGFYYLYAKHLQFDISEKMIGVNRQGKVKVWMNENFAQNHPQNQKPFLYLNKNLTEQGQVSEKINKIKFQNKIIKQILEIVNSKQALSTSSFENILEKRLHQSGIQISLSSKGFQQILQALCKYQEKSGNQVFIPNKLVLEEHKESALPQRQSFSIKLQKAIEQYRRQKQMQAQTIYSTGTKGNTLKKYLSKDSSKDNLRYLQKPSVKFLYQSKYFVPEYDSRFNAVDAQSQIIGLKRGQYNERLDDFNSHQSRQLSSYIPVSTYVPGEFEHQLRNMTKDLAQTNFKSIGGDSYYNFTKNSQLSMENFANDYKLNHSASELNWLSSYKPQQISNYNNESCKANQSQSYSTGFSTYKQKLTATYLKYSGVNSFMRIPQQMESKEESVRPSLASINCEVKSSFGKAVDSEKRSHLKFQQQKETIPEQNVFLPVIESRFTDQKNSNSPKQSKSSPEQQRGILRNQVQSIEYVQKPFIII